MWAKLKEEFISGEKISEQFGVNRAAIEEVKGYLKTKFIGRDICYFDTIDSTNIKAKELANKKSSS